MLVPVLTYYRLETLRIWGGSGEPFVDRVGGRTVRGASNHTRAGWAVNHYGVAVDECRRQIAGCLFRRANSK